MLVTFSNGYYRQLAQDAGWGVKHTSEAIVALALQRLGFKSRAQVESGELGRIVETQFRLGPYTLDFAFVPERIAIEADGNFHDQRQKHDAWRDKRMAEWEWDVIRVRTDGIDIEATIGIIKEALRL